MVAILFLLGIAITKSELINAYELLKKESFELGFEDFIDEVNEQIIPLLLEDKEDEASKFVDRKRTELWRTYVKNRIEDVEKTLKPKPIFSEEVFSKVREIREKYTSVEAKSEEVTVIENYRQLIKEVEGLNEIVERERQRSAFNFLWKALEWGIVVSLASLTIMFYFVPPTIYVVPIPFGITIVIALIGYRLVRTYPYIERRLVILLVEFAIALISTIALVLVTGKPY
jgi:hypothetical protein